jgi:hypothetical protein
LIAEGTAVDDWIASPGSGDGGLEPLARGRIPESRAGRTEENAGAMMALIAEDLATWSKDPVRHRIALREKRLATLKRDS